MEQSSSLQPALQASINSQKCFQGFAESEIYAQPTNVVRCICGILEAILLHYYSAQIFVLYIIISSSRT
jgi:hypothetical protein